MILADTKMINYEREHLTNNYDMRDVVTVFITRFVRGGTLEFSTWLGLGLRFYTTRRETFSTNIINYKQRVFDEACFALSILKADISTSNKTRYTPAQLVLRTVH